MTRGKSDITAIAISAVTHILLLLTLLEENVNSGYNSGSDKVTIVPRAVTTEIRYKGKGPGKSKPKPKKSKCKEWYGGIGIIEAMGEIWSVYPGYPAADAGLLAGDRIIGTEEVRGEVGTILEIDVNRGEKLLHFKITRGRICYDR